MCAHVFVLARACVRLRVRVYVFACVCACIRARVRVRVRACLKPLMQSVHPPTANPAS